MKKTLVSIIVPTRNSELHIGTLLQSVKSQNYKDIEIIIVDNESQDRTVKIAKKYGARVMVCKGRPPLVAKQRNIGAKAAAGNYLYFMDHDMELSENFLKHFERKVKHEKTEIDAWYIPERIISNSKLLSSVRNFEGSFINGTVVSAARIIKRQTFFLTNGYDESLSGGPADWDFDIQLKLRNARFAIFDKYIYHHEENLKLFSYIFKKTSYLEGGEIYKKKWKKENKYIFENIVKKQYGATYRLFGIFFEKGKWRKLIQDPFSYALFLFVKISMSANYLYAKQKHK